MSNIPVSLTQVVSDARHGKPEALEKLFAAFLADGEQLVGCGHLGSLGVVFPEHSFWCVTDLRACSLRIKRGGQITFQSGYLSHINSDAFYQPSLLLLWVIVAAVLVASLGIGILLVPLIVRMFYKLRKSGVVFWVGEGIPVYVFADRQNLHKAQQVSVLIADGIRRGDRSN